MFCRLFFVLILAVSANCVSAAPEVRIWQTVGGNRFEGSLVRTDGDKVILQRKNSNQTVTVMRQQLVEADHTYLDEVAKQQKPAPGPPGPAAEGGKNALYPRTKEEIRSGLQAILKRDRPKETSKEIHAALCLLNAYRFLSGVFDNVVADAEMIKGAAEAAAACATAGRIGHDLGHSTEKCNISLGHNDLASPLDGYMKDPFDNNRAQRGHRRSLLTPAMRKTGFGKKGKFGAMWNADTSGEQAEGPWAYPAQGYYPLEYLHGDSWSFYTPASLPQDTKVRIWKLTEPPKEPIPWEQEPKVREIPVKYSYVFENTINFEPLPSILGRKGIYWIRIQGTGVQEQYVTELF